MRISYLDGPRLRRTLLAASAHAQESRRELNRINVFPVPDGDTGTNLALTLRAVEAHLRRFASPSVSDVARRAAEGAVIGARGNCGMMLSHFLNGFAASLEGDERAQAVKVAHALKRGSANLYAALDKPVEGTMLTVVREAAEVAVASRAEDIADLMEEVLAEARASLARTPDLLPVLKKAGVVDAGATGLVRLLEGAVGFIDGSVEAAVGSGAGRAFGPEEESAAVTDALPEQTGAAAVEYPSDSERYRYCTEGMVRGAGLPSERDVRDVLRAMGDSILVIRAGSVLKVHIHSDDPEGIFGYLGKLGELVTRKAEDMHLQHATVRAAGGHGTGLARRPVAVVTDTAADLPPEVISAHGIHVTPLLLIGSDRTYRDGIDLTSEEFHLRLAEETGRLPTTSQPTPGDFRTILTQAAEDGETVIAVLLGSTLSGTMQSALAAADLLDTPVLVADSLGASLLEGLMVLRACECAEAGWKPREIVREVEEVRTSSGIILYVETLRRLVASGRVSPHQARIAGLLGLKPIVEIDRDGKVASAGRGIGRRHARSQMFRILSKRLAGRGQKRVRFGVVHVGVPEVISEVTREIRERYGEDTEVLASPATPTLSTHVGLGAWGIAWSVDDGPPPLRDAV